MRIERRAYCNITELYALDIDQAYLDQLTADVRKQTLSEVPDITEEIITEAIGNTEDIDNPLNCELVMKGYRYDTKGDTYIDTLFRVIEDWVNSDIWDSYVETIYQETEDYETDVIPD